VIGLTCFLLTVIFIGAIFFKKKFTELVLGIVLLAPGEGSSSLDYWKRWFVRTMAWDLVTDLVTRGKYAFRKRKEGPPDIPPHTPPPDDRGQYLPPEAPPERREEARPPEETPSASAPLKPESVKQGAVVADRYTPRVSPPWEASRRPGHAESTEGFSEDGTAFLVFEGGEERGSLPEPGTPSEEPQAEDLRRAGQTLSSRREKFLFRRRGPRILFKKLDLKVLLRNSGLKPLFRKLVLESRELKLKGRNRRCLFGEAITAFLRGCFLLRKEKILPHGEATAAFLRGRFLSREVGIPFKGGKVLPRGKTAAGSLSI